MSDQEKDTWEGVTSQIAFFNGKSPWITGEELLWPTDFEL